MAGRKFCTCSRIFYITCQYKPRNIRLFIATYTGIRQKQNSLKKYKKIDNNKIIILR